MRIRKVEEYTANELSNIRFIVRETSDTIRKVLSFTLPLTTNGGGGGGKVSLLQKWKKGICAVGCLSFVQVGNRKLIAPKMSEAVPRFPPRRDE